MKLTFKNVPFRHNSSCVNQIANLFPPFLTKECSNIGNLREIRQTDKIVQGFASNNIHLRF